MVNNLKIWARLAGPRSSAGETLTIATGATEEIECMISDRVDCARQLLDDIALNQRELWT